MAPAPRLVLLAPADVLGDEIGVARDGASDALMEHGVGSTYRADRRELVDALCHGHERRQRLERLAGERHVQARDHYDDAPSSELFRNGDQFDSEEVSLVDRDEVDGGVGLATYRRRRGNRSRWEVEARVRRDPSLSTRIELMGEHLDPATGDHGAPNATEQLLRLAGEHRTGDHLEPT